MSGDLEFAKAAAEMALEVTPASDNEPAPTGKQLITLRSLWNAAVVAYARCFLGGVRQTRLGGVFARTGERETEFRRAHQYIIDLRTSTSLIPLIALRMFKSSHSSPPACDRKIGQKA
jgi:hypothetical protein